MQRLFVLGLILLATVTAAAAVASAAKPKHRTTTIRLYVPDPGHVAVEVAKVHLSGKTVSKFKLPRRFHLVNAQRYPGAVAMIAAKLQRRKSGETVTLVAVVVNGSPSGGARTLAGLHRASAATSSKAGGGGPAEVTLGDGEGDDWNLVWTAAAQSGFESREIKGRIASLTFFWSFAAAAKEDGLSPDDQAAFFRALKNIFAEPDKWDPTGKPPPPSDPNLDTGHYDDGHAFGWKKGDDQGVVDGLKLATAPPDLVPDLAETIYADAGARAPLYKFSFDSLSATIDPGAGGLPPFTETFSGTACGAHAVTAPWAITISIPPSALPPISGVDLSEGSPVTIVTHTTKQNDVVVGTATSTLQVVATGGVLKTQDMELNVTTTGTERVTSSVPVDAPIVPTPLAAGASC